MKKVSVRPWGDFPGMKGARREGSKMCKRLKAMQFPEAVP